MFMQFCVHHLVQSHIPRVLGGGGGGALAGDVRAGGRGPARERSHPTRTSCRRPTRAHVPLFHVSIKHISWKSLLIQIVFQSSSFESPKKRFLSPHIIFYLPYCILFFFMYCILIYIFTYRQGEVKSHFGGVRKRAEFLEFLKKYSRYLF